jgi:hypothetical protein
VEYCPSKVMVADFFTKPLQGSHCTKLHNHIMNINPAWQDYTSEDSICVLNVVATCGEQTEHVATDSGWTVVETKKSKRLVSRMTGSLSRNDHGNGEAKGKRVRFEKLD